MNAAPPDFPKCQVIPFEPRIVRGAGSPGGHDDQFHYLNLFRVERLILGMRWALKWVSHRGVSPSRTIEMLSAGEDARSLAEAYDQLTRRIDQLMKDSAEKLFGEREAEP